MDITYEVRDNPIFERKEVRGIVVSNSTISKKKLITEMSVKFKVKENHIDIKYITNKRGRKESEFFALIYSKPIKEDEKKEEETSEAEGTSQEEEKNE